MRFFWMTALLLTALQGRENPFVPVETAGAKVRHTTAAVPGSSARSVPQERTAVKSTEAKAEIASFQGIRFLVRSDGMKIETEDKLIKHFSIMKPTRFILDFKSDADFPTRSRALHRPPFKALRMGVHKGFYRVVLELEGSHDYSIKPYRYGYILLLR